MICCKQGNKPKTIDVTLTFKMEQLLYDAKLYCHIEGSVLMPDTPDHNRHMVQDIGEEGYVDRALRVLNLCHAGAVELLLPYTKKDVSEAMLDDELREPDEYRIEMSVPEGFSQTTLNLLEGLIHDWLVCKVVYDWLTITDTEKATVWAVKVDELETEIRRSIMTRRDRSRIKLHPF